MTEVYYQVHMTRILHTAKTSEKNIFLCFFTELKTYHLSYSLIPDDFRRSVGYYLDIKGNFSLQFRYVNTQQVTRMNKLINPLIR